MSSHRNSVRQSTENQSASTTQLHEVEYVWTIENFRLHETSGKRIKSPTFAAATNDAVKWYLIVKPNGKTDAKDTVSLYLSLSRDSEPKKIFAVYSVCAVNRQRKEICRTDGIAKSRVHEFSADSDDDGSNRLRGRSEFLVKNSDFRNTILVDDKLTVVCTVIFSPASDAFDRVNTFHRFRTAQLYPNLQESNLVEDFEQLMYSHEFADIVLSVKSKEYPAHKAILAARSSVFAAMFKHYLKENETNRIEVEDMDEEVAAEMLRYIYTGKCKNVEELADGLLAAADKYDLNVLKMISAEGLCKTLSVNNAANILALADLHRVPELKSETIKFIVASFAEVVLSPAWEHLIVSHPSLVQEVCRAVGGWPTKEKSTRKRKSRDRSSTNF